jgi:sigma-B regulation protein RsbU (phosphoserine phosphatase)
VVLADVSGKGVPAAIFMSNIRAIVHALAREAAAPNELLTRLSSDVLADTAARLYATCIIALVDPEERTMTYSNAGHPAGVLASAWGVRPLRAGGPPVGLLEGATYDIETVAFGEGDIITLVSDGVSEALDAPSDLLPFAIAEEILRAHSYTMMTTLHRTRAWSRREGTGLSLRVLRVLRGENAGLASDWSYLTGFSAFSKNSR